MGVFASNWSAQTATAFSARACRGMVVGDADERAKRVVVARRVRRWEACILDGVFVLFSWVGEIGWVLSMMMMMMEGMVWLYEKECGGVCTIEMEKMVDTKLFERSVYSKLLISQSKARRSVCRQSERLLNYRSVSVQTALSNVANWSIAMCRLGGSRCVYGPAHIVVQNHHCA
jgi:hypothetical protein